MEDKPKDSESRARTRGRRGGGEQSEGPTEDEKICFVIGPIGAPGSEVRRRFEAIVDHVVRPALEPLEFRVEDPHRTFDAGSITQRVVERLLTAQLVVADLTGHNPNVMYELAVRHAKRLPVVQIMRAPLELPFDLKDELTIEYVDDIQGAADLRNSLREAAGKAMVANNLNNPIFRAAQAVNVEVSIDGEPGDFQIVVLDRLNEIQAVVADLGRNKGLLSQGSGRSGSIKEALPRWPSGTYQSDRYYYKIYLKSKDSDKVKNTTEALLLNGIYATGIEEYSLDAFSIKYIEASDILDMDINIKGVAIPGS